MEETSENKPIKHICTGLLAHVDAGKTTLAESMLYLSGSIRKLGRVDHGDAFLDTFELERARGITIFSKQAEIILGEKPVTLLDTPGHVDFSAEMERTLQVLDYAVLVISQADGVQGHVQTLWKLLKRYRIPVFLFVNKMDQSGASRQRLMEELKGGLDDGCLDFGEDQDRGAFMENLAVCDEEALERYLENGSFDREEIVELIGRRKVFPCYFGSALKLEGVEGLMKGLEQYTAGRSYPEEFGARVFKIARDDQGSRLTYMKITGGCLKVKMPLTNRKDGMEETGGGTKIWEEKADQIRIYSGARFQTINEARAGTVCAVTGLKRTYSGQGLGIEAAAGTPVLQPVLTYEIRLPDGCDIHQMFLKLGQLEEEEPELQIVWNERLNEIHAQVMGEVQIEILKSLIAKRFGVNVEFGSGNIVYKETIEGAVEGVGHFEPLRHYAEVHLLMEPGEPGSGMQFESMCSEDMLDRNWQRLILTHLEEKRHRGVLTGSEIMDMKITLTAGRAHQKHTEGGDFRQATYRAVRQGLRKARSVLLEPVYEYRLEVPSRLVGRAMADIQRMHGNFSPPRTDGEVSVLAGCAPVAAMQGYQREVMAYTSGEGRLFCSLKGYEPCHNAGEVIGDMGYDPEKDLENPTGSVFCSHGAGYVVPWNEVERHMHVDGLKLLEHQEEIPGCQPEMAIPRKSAPSGWQGDKELEEIFTRTYGSSRQERNGWGRMNAEVKKDTVKKTFVKREEEEEYLLVDGYNIIFAWEELKELADISIEGARNKLMDILCNYQGYKKNTLILVFDAYQVEGNRGEIQKYNNIYVVYTKEAETADQYIEKTVHEIGRKYRVTVATSDALEQVIIMGQGAGRLSAQGLKDEVRSVNIEIRSSYLDQHKRSRNYIFQNLPEDMADFMEEVRLGRKTFAGEDGGAED